MIHTVQSSNYSYQSRIEFEPANAGFVVCHVKNDEGHAEAMAYAMVSDLDRTIDIWGPVPGPAVANEDTSHICGASVFMYTEINWYREGVLIENKTGTVTSLTIDSST